MCYENFGKIFDVFHMCIEEPKKKGDPNIFSFLSTYACTSSIFCLIHKFVRSLNNLSHISLEHYTQCVPHSIAYIFPCEIKCKFPGAIFHQFERKTFLLTFVCTLLPHDSNAWVFFFFFFFGVHGHVVNILEYLACVSTSSSLVQPVCMWQTYSVLSRYNHLLTNISFFHMHIKIRACTQINAARYQLCIHVRQFVYLNLNELVCEHDICI